MFGPPSFQMKFSGGLAILFDLLRQGFDRIEALLFSQHFDQFDPYVEAVNIAVKIK
jgi:hypothetical protein